MSDAPLDELPEFTEELTGASLEAPADAPAEISPEAPAEETEPSQEKREPGWLVSSFNVYNTMLLVALLALVTATVLLVLEWGRYGFTLGPPNR